MPKARQEDVQKSVEITEKSAARVPRKKQAPKPKQTARKPADPDRTADTGDTVTVEYSGTLPNGRIFDKATPENPFTFTIGANQVLPVFEHLIRGMKVGDTKTFSIHPMEAYGIWREDLVVTVDRNSFPEGEEVVIGKRARATAGDGNEYVMKVIDVTDEEVKLDGNHPLAGYTLTYHDLKLTAIE